jgi:CheY-like chemotaxis protein
MSDTDDDLKETILVIDDEKAVLQAVQLILSRAGYKVLTAESGSTGFQILERRAQTNPSDMPVSLVIVDWKMPGWDGLRVLSEIRRQPYKDLPIILMSGAVTREQLLSTAAKNATSVLLKPIDKDVLLTKVADLIGPGDLAGETPAE